MGYGVLGGYGVWGMGLCTAIGGACKYVVLPVIMEGRVAKTLQKVVRCSIGRS